MKPEEDFQIYNIVDPRDSQVFYVGATHDFRHRMMQHLRSRGPVGLRIASMIECGMAPIFNILETVRTSQQANEQEQRWANHFTAMGMKLLPGSFVGYDRRKGAGRRRTSQQSEEAYQAYLAGGPCPWKRERDYVRKYIKNRA